MLFYFLLYPDPELKFRTDNTAHNWYLHFVLPIHHIIFPSFVIIARVFYFFIIDNQNRDILPIQFFNIFVLVGFFILL